MPDTIIDAINHARINRTNISFDNLRMLAGVDKKCWLQLGRGRAILTSFEQLDQYLYSYGLMTKSQWSSFLPGINLPTGKLRITDYGCGQGLGSVLLFDHFGLSLPGRVEEIKLIEPSSVALGRAEAVVNCYLGTQSAVTINKKLDDLSTSDMKVTGTLPHIHLLSNVLDINDFNHGKLFSRMFQNVGHHIVLAVSHDRDFEGGSQRFEQLESEIKKPEYSKWISITSSKITKFNCSGNQPAISWDLRVEVLSGPI